MTCSLLHNEMDQMHMACYRLVHDEYICIIACFKIGAIIFLIVTVNMEYHFILLNYRSRFGFSDIDSFCSNLVLFLSAEFFAVWVSIRVNVAQVCVFYNFTSFAIATDWDSNLRLGTRIFTWDPHFCRRGQNMFFYNCQTRKQLLIIVLYHQPLII